MNRIKHKVEFRLLFVFPTEQHKNNFIRDLKAHGFVKRKNKSYYELML